MSHPLALKSIAVLPFENASDDVNAEYLTNWARLLRRDGFNKIQ